MLVAIGVLLTARTRAVATGCHDSGVDRQYRIFSMTVRTVSGSFSKRFGDSDSDCFGCNSEFDDSGFSICRRSESDSDVVSDPVVFGMDV